MASNYVVSWKQTAVIVLGVAAVTTSALVAGLAGAAWLELPEVVVDGDGKCVKVVNYKNGDGFQCQDRDVTLRRYRLRS